MASRADLKHDRRLKVSSAIERCDGQRRGPFGLQKGSCIDGPRLITEEKARSSACSRARFRHCDGAVPMRAANTRPKCELSLKPHAKAMSVMDRSAASGADKSRAARFTRSSQTRVIRVSPRSAKICCRWRGETLSRCAISPDVRSGSSNRSAMRRLARA